MKNHQLSDIDLCKGGSIPVFSASRFLTTKGFTILITLTVVLLALNSDLVYAQLTMDDVIKGAVNKEEKEFRKERGHEVDDLDVYKTGDGTIDVNRIPDSSSSVGRSLDPTCAPNGCCWRWRGANDPYGLMAGGADQVQCHCNGTTVSDEWMCREAQEYPPNPY